LITRYSLVLLDNNDLIL